MKKLVVYCYCIQFNSHLIVGYHGCDVRNNKLFDNTAPCSNNHSVGALAAIKWHKQFDS